jgi:hypothetical protein
MLRITHTWWRLFLAYLMKVILSIPDEGYFEHTWWRLFWAYLMKVILSIPDEGYFERHLMKVILSVTWWRLFWAYLMALHFSTFHNFKHPSSSSPLFKLVKHTSIFLQSWKWGIGRGLTSGIAKILYTLAAGPLNSEALGFSLSSL